MNNAVYELSSCRRCKQEIPRPKQPDLHVRQPETGIKPDEHYPVYIPGYGTVCWHCAEVLASDDDYNDPYTGEKIL